jgi:hypothetical protein
MKKLVPIMLLLILFSAAAWYSFVRPTEAVHEALPPQLPVVAPVIREQPRTVQQDEEITVFIEPEPVTVPDPLPPLNESDAAIKQDLADIIGAEPLAQYLTKSQAISRLVVTIDSLTGRQVPPQMNPIRTADGKIVVDTEAEIVTMSAQNFERYDGFVMLMQNADTDALVAMYQYYSPLFQIAWEENGGQGHFNDRLLEVVDHLLETPDVQGPVYLTKYEAVYLFEDAELEAMTAGQKVLVRMGSVNAELVKQKLAEIRSGLKP